MLDAAVLIGTGVTLLYGGTRFVYNKIIDDDTIDNKNASNIDTIAQEGLYHFTSLESAKKILESNKILPSNYINSYGNKKCFFFSGKPTIWNILINLSGTKKADFYKKTAIRIRPNYEQLKEFKIRPVDNAVTKSGVLDLSNMNTELVYMILDDSKGELDYKEVTYDEYLNYVPSEDLISKTKKYQSSRVRNITGLIMDIKNVFKKIKLHKSSYDGLTIKKGNKLENEQLFFTELLDNINSLDNFDYNKEYNKKKHNYNINEEQYDISNLLEDSKTLNLYNEIKNIKKEFLYKSDTHGISHNIKTLIFGSLIGKSKNLNSNEMKIIKDACKYHDIGRNNDLIDDTHGLRSSNMIDNVIIDDPFYNDKNNLNMLKAIMEIHSIDDKENEVSLATKYNINLEEFRKLYSILKDADALDRTRLSVNIPFISDLNPKYLRNKESFGLIKLSHQLNYIYRKLYKKRVIVDNYTKAKLDSFDYKNYIIINEFKNYINNIINNLNNMSDSDIYGIFNDEDMVNKLVNNYNINDEKLINILNMMKNELDNELMNEINLRKNNNLNNKIT